MKRACGALERAALHGVPFAELAGLLEGVRRAREQAPPRPTVVWTGPELAGGSHRLTGAVVAQLVDEASATVLLVSFALHEEPQLSQALRRATSRGVGVTVLGERKQDNPSYHGPSNAFSELPITRYSWPASRRPEGASLHAKLLVVDHRIALVGSANITQSAMEKNLECGLILRDPASARELESHLEELRIAGHLKKLAAGLGSGAIG